jgi:hypothetical protein
MYPRRELGYGMEAMGIRVKMLTFSMITVLDNEACPISLCLITRHVLSLCFETRPALSLCLKIGLPYHCV